MHISPGLRILIQHKNYHEDVANWFRYVVPFIKRNIAGVILQKFKHDYFKWPALYVSHFLIKTKFLGIIRRSIHGISNTLYNVLLLRENLFFKF